MAKVVMTCGRICSGKSTYAENLRHELNAVVLSVDEITLALFGNDAGNMHDVYVERLKNYLFKKSVELIDIGVNVILDWGLWTKAEREQARAFYKNHGTECEIHYLDISEEEWKNRLTKRNELVAAGKTSAYYVDEGLAEKFCRLFEVPYEEEIDVRISIL